MTTLPISTPSIQLDTLFDRTRTAIETTNKSKMANGKKTDAKIQAFIATQYGKRSWHDLVKELKLEKNSNRLNLIHTFQHIEGLSDEHEELLLAEFDSYDELLKHAFSTSSSSFNNHEQQKFISNTITQALHCSSKESAISLIEEEFNKIGALEVRKLVVDKGHKTFGIIHDENIETSTLHIAGKEFQVPTAITNKLSTEEIFDLLSDCYSNADVRKINEELGMTKISLEHKTRHLKSCEEALEEEQDKYYAKTWQEENQVIPLITRDILDFLNIYERNQKGQLADAINNNTHLYEFLIKDLNQYLDKNKNATKNDETMLKIISGLSDKKLTNVNLDYTFNTVSSYHKHTSFNELQIAVYSFAYDELIKDTLIPFLNILINEPKNNQEWNKSELEELFNNNIKNIF